VNTFANVSGSVTLSESYAYDDNSNLTSKGNVGYYQYNVTGKPNRLAAIWQNRPPRYELQLEATDLQQRLKRLVKDCDIANFINGLR